MGLSDTILEEWRKVVQNHFQSIVLAAGFRLCGGRRCGYYWSVEAESIEEEPRSSMSRRIRQNF